MRLLRLAIAAVWEIMEKQRSEIHDDAAWNTLTELEVELMDALAHIQIQGRETLVIHGVHLPIDHPIALGIMGCPNCHAAVCAQVEHDYQEGVMEDAMLDACPEHTRAANQYARDEVILRGMKEQSEKLYHQLIRHMHGGERSDEDTLHVAEQGPDEEVF